MDDGMIQLRVEATMPHEVRCVVVAGGRISDHKGISLPHVDLPASCLTDKDIDDLKFGIEQGVDFVAVSFVRTADDIREVRKFLEAQGADIPLVAKLERHEVLDNLAAVVAAVDAVMVARGDLGVDVPLEDVPHIQKEIIRQAHAAKVPVIVATQMLESMVTHMRPTRAEVADVTAAIFDTADAIMLSAETASGRYPAEAVEVMARIAERAEQAALTQEPTRRRRENRAPVGFPEAVSDAAASAARALDARAIVAFTQSGFSARLISQERPATPIIAFTPFAAVQRRLALTWGVTSRPIRKVETTDEVEERIKAGQSLTGKVLAAGHTLVLDVEAVTDVPAAELAAIRRLGYTTFLGVPLKIGGRAIGVLTFRARRPFSARDRELAEAFAGQSAIAIEHARLVREASEQADRMRALADLSRVFAGTLDPDVVSERIADSVRSLFRSEEHTSEL